jgi:hypothetical protein
MTVWPETIIALYLHAHYIEHDEIYRLSQSERVMKAQMTKTPLSTNGTKVKVKIELSSEINISPFIARQKANVFLLTHLGNLVWANEPKLSMSNGGLHWIVPICYTIPNHSSTQVGELAIDVNNGEVILTDSTLLLLKK